jgi:lipopolysaccharide transport system ATP-binding protein
MPPIIRVKDLGKRYRIDRAAPRGGKFAYRTLRDDLVRLAGAPLRRLRGSRSGRAEDFWALKDVAFEVDAGEVVGVIGKNGAGKSTLLKVLSRITKPTTGRAELRGRLGSLLEVGTGFHPELTGRENVFLNGAILGMRRREIARKFDEIVAFAEVEKFLDTPVKRYSSGMYVRLAFAVAAHLEPEILIVDEVLAVGDLAFQRKCLGRMREVGRAGTTVLFVSHNMPAVESLCTRAILLDGGRAVRDGEVPDLIAEYRRRVLSPPKAGPPAFGNPGGIFRSAQLLDQAGEPTSFLPLGSLFHLRIGLEADSALELPTVGVGIDDPDGQRLLTVHTPLSHAAVPQLAGRCELDCRVEQFPLAPGDYWVKLAIGARGADVDTVDRALHFTVVNGDAFGEGWGFQRGVCVVPSSWSLPGARAAAGGGPGA